MKKMTAFLLSILMLTAAQPICAYAGYELSEDGIYYSDSPAAQDEFIPKPGTVYYWGSLKSLAARYPDAKFAVHIQSWVHRPDYLDEEIRPFMDSHTVGNGMTYTEFWKAWFAVAEHGPANDEEQKALDELKPYLSEMQTAVRAYLEDEYIPEIRRQEAEQLAASGIGGPGYAVMTAPQVLDFAGHEKCGYFLSLAMYSDLPENQPEPISGDANTDGSVDIMDVVYVNKFLLGSGRLSEKQRKCADVNQDGIIEPSDALNILHYVVGTIDSFVIAEQPELPENADGFGNYDAFAAAFEKKYETKPFAIPDREAYHFGISFITLEQNSYKFNLKPFGNLDSDFTDNRYVTLTVYFQGEYADYDRFLGDYVQMSQKIEHISESHAFLLMEDDSLILCGRMPGGEQVFVIDADAKDTEEDRALLLRLAEKLEI